MLNSFHLSIILFLLPAYQMSFFAVQLLSFNSKKDPSRKPLGFLMLFMLLYILINISKYLGYLDAYKYLYFFQLPVLLTIIPTYCRYLWAISGSSGRITSKPLLLCYLPALLILLLNLFAFFTYGTEAYTLFLYPEQAPQISDKSGVNLIFITFLLGNAVLIAFQIIMATYQFRKHMQHVQAKRKEESSFLPYFETGWAYFIFASIICFVIANSLMNYLVPEYSTLTAAVFNVIILISGSLAGYFSLKQDKLYTEVASLKPGQILKEVDKNEGNEKSVSSKKMKIPDNMSKKEAKEIIEKLLHHLTTDKPHLNIKLRLIDISRSLDISKHKLTYVINHEMDSSFYGIINEYRVMEAKMLLKHPKYKKYKIETIAEMSGFQSKSTFNGCFKTITEVTPSAYRKSMEPKIL